MQLPNILFLLSLLATTPSVSAAPTPSSDLSPRQLGGGPNGSGVGTGWSATWRDTTLLEPNTFTTTRGAGCSYTVSFRRDVRDTGKYKLSYWSVFNTGELRNQEEKRPSQIGFRGATGADGRREYFAVVDDACSTFYNDRRRPLAFKVYFTESTESRANYLKTFNAS